MLVLLAGAVAGYAWYLNHEIHRVDLPNLTSAPAHGADAGTENILMIGSTDRCALKVQNPAYGLCSQGVNGMNSDVVMILHLNPATHRLSILSIPRDLFVPNARKEGANKIDAALYERSRPAHRRQSRRTWAYRSSTSWSSTSTVSSTW